MDSSTLQTTIFLLVLLNILMLVFIMLQVSRQTGMIKKLRNDQVTANERLNRIKISQKLVRQISKNVFEGYTNARGQPRMTTDFLATYSTMQNELESLVVLIDDTQLSAFVEQGLMPEAPGTTGDWTTQLGKKTKLTKRIHTRLYELLEEAELFENVSG